MKYKVFAILTALLLFASAFSASAATVTVSFDAGANGIDVSGTVPEATHGGDDLLLIVKNAAGEGILAARTKSVYSASGVTYAFDKQLMSATLPGDDYTVIVSGQDFTAPATTTFTYTNPIMVYNALKDLRDNSVSTKTAAEVCAAFERNAEALGLATDDYKNLKEDGEGKGAFAALLKTVEYNLPTDYTYSAEVAEEIEKVKSMCEKAGAAGLFIDIETSAELESWYAAFYDDLGFNDGTDVGAVTPLLVSVKGTDSFVDRVADVTGTPTIEEIKTELYGSALLTAVETETDAKVKTVMETTAYQSYFPGLDISGYNALTPSLKKNTVISAFSGYYETLTAAAAAFNAQVILAAKDSDDDDDDKVVSKSYGGGGGGSVYVPAKPKEDEAIGATAIFNDLGSVSWAEDAINHLYSKGIINGKGAGVFAPQDSVTRAELVKMVMTAIGETGDASSAGFNDVAASDWFAPYVTAAKARGIVTGDEKGSFNPNAPISREDIATILYRTVEGGTAKADAAFTDSAAISGYAKEAVNYFAENGIINGLGDGSFGPRQNATRAEAAVILYRLMTIIIS